MISNTEFIITTLKASLGMNVFPVVAPENSPLPFVVYTVSVGPMEQTLGGSTGYRDEAYTFTIYASTYEAVCNIRDDMSTVLEALTPLALTDDNGEDGGNPPDYFTKTATFSGTFEMERTLIINQDNAVSASYATTASYVAGMSSPTWETVQGKPTNLVSSSAQIDFNDIKNKPTISISSSYAETASYYALPVGLVSGSHILSSSYATNAAIASTASYYEVASQSWDDIQSKPSGIVSSSSQISYTDIINKPAAYVLPDGVVSGSDQIDYNNIQNKPTTIATASYYNVPSQSFNDVTGKPSLVSASAQINYTDIINKPAAYVLPSGVVSGSSQIDYTGIINKPTLVDSSSYSATASYALNAGAGGVSVYDTWIYSGY